MPTTIFLSPPDFQIFLRPCMMAAAGIPYPRNAPTVRPSLPSVRLRIKLGIPVIFISFTQKLATLGSPTILCKGGLISESFFTLVQISKKRVSNHDPEHLLFRCKVHRRVICILFRDLNQREKLSKIMPPLLDPNRHRENSLKILQE